MRRCIEEVRRAGERASQLTTQLLAFARRRVITPSAVELNAAILALAAVSYTHLRAHETVLDLVCRLLLAKHTKLIYHLLY